MLVFVLPLFSGIGVGALLVEPTSLGQAIIGFHPGAMPSLEAGDPFGGHEVLGAYARAGFVVVSAEDLVPLRLSLNGDARVAYIEDDRPLHALVVPEDPRWGEQYGPVMMGFPAAWSRTLGWREITVAVIDSGIQRDHEDFDPALMLQGHNYVRNNNDPDDDCGHGTHVAGTVGAWTNNGKGVAGMAQVKILPMKVLSPSTISCSGSTSNVALAIRDAADQGADVINLSLGGGASTTLQNAVAHAWNQGALVVAAAGNDGGCCVNAPASYEAAIAVSALGSNKQLASYSSRGPQVEIAAPGSNIISTYTGGGYRSLSGTSMAAPHVAGALALALSWNPSMTNVELRNLLHATAEDLGTPGRDPNFGYGLARIDDLFDQLAPPIPGPDNLAPVVSFTTRTDGHMVTFEADVADPDGDPLVLSWDLGDGSTRSDAAFTHTYDADGVYSVTLEADDGRGGWSRLTDVLDLVTVDHPDPAPHILEITAGSPVSFTIEAGEERVYKFLLDGYAQVLQSRATGPGCLVPGLPVPGITCQLDGEFAVRYGAPPTDTEATCRVVANGVSGTCNTSTPKEGWWFLRLKATEGEGTVQLRVDPQGSTPVVRPDNQAPRVIWGYEAYGHDVVFRSDWVSDADGDPLSYLWDFGDGTTSTEPETDHTFSSLGEHEVSLTVSDGRGGVTSLAGTITLTEAPINDPPVALFSWTGEGHTVHFDARDSYDPDGDDLTYRWTFGDGWSLYGPTVSYTYEDLGTYNVTLTVRDIHGAPATVTHEVTVEAPHDPAPEVPTLERNDPHLVRVSAGEEHHFKVLVPDDEAHLLFSLSGSGCNFMGCPQDVDLAVRHEAPVTDEDADCRRDTTDANGHCLFGSPAGGWWFIRLDGVSGSGQVTIRAEW